MRGRCFCRAGSKEYHLAERRSAEFSLETIGGRTLRVARWNWNSSSAHLPLLFFNGIGTNIEAIAPLAEALTERRFITFDMPGVGGSPDPLVPYNPCTISLVAADLLDRFEAGQADVMGVSWGGGIAQQFTLQHSSRVRRLVLAATCAGIAMVPGNPFAIASLADPARIGDPDFVASHFKTIFGGMVGNHHEHLARVTPPSSVGYFYQLLAMAGWTSAPALPLLKQDTLIMMGDEDPIMPLANGHILHTLIPNSRLEVFKRGGHLFMLSHQAQTLRLLRRFLDTPDTLEKAAA